MKKVIYFALSVLLLVSCGKAKEENPETQAPVKQVDLYSVVIEALYEKDDSISVVVQQQGYFNYDKAISKKIVGAPTLQRIEFLLPEGEKIENIGCMISSNKEQKGVTIKNISVMNNGTVVLDGNDSKFGAYFLFDESFKIDKFDGKSFKYFLTQTNKYPPGIRGNDKFLALFSNK
jgi:hypothetical protein